MRPLMKVLLVVAATITAGVGLLPEHGEAQNYTAPTEPVLIELFTSQGCSSCPPADRLAQRLDQEPGLVVISRPVTYWDRLGWKDTLALEDNTDLQYAYAERGLRGYNGVYTPQSVVSGSLGAVGSQEPQVRRLITAAAQKRDAAIRARGDATRGFGIGLAGMTDREAELVLIGVQSHAEVAIGRGENRGRRIAYTNVLKGERKITNWRGGKASYVIEASALNIPGADRYAMVLRQPGAGPVLAARWLN